MPGFLKHRANGWTMVFAGLWRVTEWPWIARYPASGKERKRVHGVKSDMEQSTGVSRRRGRGSLGAALKCRD